MRSVSIAVSWLLLPPEVGVNRHGLIKMPFTACHFQVVREDTALRGRYGEAHAGSCVSYLLFDLLCSCQ